MPDFATSVERLLNQIRYWEQPRWSMEVLGQSRADLTYALVQRLADLGADAGHRDHRAVPREHDMLLPDQIRVMADDLLAADPPIELLETAATAVNAVRDAFGA